MKEWMANMYAVMATIPFVTFFIIYLAVRWIKGDSTAAVGWAINVTTFFLISAVSTMYGLISAPQSASFFWWILLFWLVITGGMGFLQLKLKGGLNLVKLTRAAWRVTFVALSITYVIFFFIGIARFFRMT